MFADHLKPGMSELVARALSGATGPGSQQAFVTAVQRLLQHTHCRVNATTRRSRWRRQAAKRCREFTDVDAGAVNPEKEASLGKMRKKFALVLQDRDLGSKDFFRRISGKQTNYFVNRLTKARNQILSQSSSLADRIGKGWAPILEEKYATKHSDDWQRKVNELYCFSSFSKVANTDNKRLMANFSEDEVQDALIGMQRGKAAGIDRMPNDFFKDYCDLLVALLACEFNWCADNDAFLAVFDAAVITPLPKCGDSEGALDYRPIAPLSSMYKIFTKLLSSRLQRILPALVGNEQSGFVHEREPEDSDIVM